MGAYPKRLHQHENQNRVCYDTVAEFSSVVRSEDSCEDMTSGEESLSSSLGSDSEGSYFPLHFHRQNRKQHTSY